jgi:hypothetical protein
LCLIAVFGLSPHALVSGSVFYKAKCVIRPYFIKLVSEQRQFKDMGWAINP